MGASGDYYPTLLCTFESGNEEQKQYCIKLKDNFHHEKSIRFDIKSGPDTKFKISFRLNGKIYEIQDIFDDSDEALNESLEQIYILLDKENSLKNKFSRLGLLLNQPLEKMKKLLKKRTCEDNKYFLPTLLCFFECGNKEQKQYCIKLKDNFRHEKSIRFEIKSSPDTEFEISFRLLNDMTYLIQDIFDDSDEILNESLEKIYALLDERDILEKSHEKKKYKFIKTKQNKIRVITIFFESSDKTINYKLYCIEDSIFKDIEEILCQEFAELRNIKKHYLYNGNPIVINKTFEENEIKDNSHIIIVKNNISNVNDESFSNLIENK